MSAAVTSTEPLPVQLIVMGCPGSGKSFMLKEHAPTDDDFLFRTTFHSELSYGDFVGVYKPVPLFVDSGNTTFSADGQEIKGNRHKKIPVIMYDFRAGPFINAYVKAILNPTEKVVLIIEEINRANPAAVFGDILQLLDRDENDVSDYGIDTHDDLRSYLVEKFRATMTADDAIEAARSLRLPSNLHIWGTMNRADESVNFIDSAFLRRWTMKYLPYDTSSAYGKDVVQVNGEDMSWDDLRGGINAKLAALDGIEDDKFIGPYFLKRSELRSKEKVASKLITYLWQDVVPMERDELFEDKTLGEAYGSWDAGRLVLKI